MTLLHHAEHLAPIPDKRVARMELPLPVGGGARWTTIEEYDTSRGVADWPDRFFAAIVDAFVAQGRARRGPLGGATALLLDAASLVDHAVAVMVETAGARQALK